MQKTWAQSPGQEDLLEKEISNPPIFLLRKFHKQRSLEGYCPWGCKRVGYNLATKQQTYIHNSYNTGMKDIVTSKDLFNQNNN